MLRVLIENATIVNEGESFTGNVLIEGEQIAAVSAEPILVSGEVVRIPAEGKLLIPGMIDDQVHFREPGLTHKADLTTESRAAVAGGITSYMEMPNTKPQALTQDLLQDKYDRARDVSLANYSFYMGASNDNLEEVLKTDPNAVCGVKIFMGSSTGNMLVDDEEVLNKIFAQCKMLIATHCEDEETVRSNMEEYREKYGEDVPIQCHPEIRSEEACYKSSSRAVRLAKKHGARLHILHISTARELELFRNDVPLEDKRITAEACIHHMWFTDEDYAKKGTHIKWNPAVKTQADRDAIVQAVRDDRIDVIATDHAPHTLEEKDNTYFKAPSGGPLVQHALVALMEMVHQGKFTIEEVVQKTAHNVARMFDIEQRGFIRVGYYADLVLIDPNDPWEVKKDNILYKCGWSPFEGTTFQSKITHTFVNGHLAWDNGMIDDRILGKRLSFQR